MYYKDWTPDWQYGGAAVLSQLAENFNVRGFQGLWIINNITTALQT